MNNVELLRPGGGSLVGRSRAEIVDKGSRPLPVTSHIPRECVVKSTGVTDCTLGSSEFHRLSLLSFSLPLNLKIETRDSLPGKINS